MASKLLKVITNIKSALQNYLGTSTTIRVFAVSDGEHSAKHCDPGIMAVANTNVIVTPHHCDPGIMVVANTNVIVAPHMDGTKLVCTRKLPPMFARLFLCTEIDSTHTRFLFAWHVKKTNWQWYIGAPYLSTGIRTSPAVPLSRENITSRARSGTVPPIEAALATMIPGEHGQPATQFNNPIFQWTKDGNDDNFQVKATANGDQLYWRAQEIAPDVTLTAGVPLSSTFKFTQIS